MSGNSLISVIIPAHNEEAVIQRTLRTLLGSAAAYEFEVMVVCNGCEDRTAEMAAAEFDAVAVLELEEASKAAAINAGFDLARGDVILLLDADIELDTDSARALARGVRQSGMEAAIGHMAVDTEGATPLVKAFYRVWMEHPYLKKGKFAAAIALSRAGLNRIGIMPPVTADDTYLRRLFPPEVVKLVDSVSFKVRAPRTLEALIRVRSRSYRGTRELASCTRVSEAGPGEVHGLLHNLLVKPSLWIFVPTYIAVTVTTRVLSYRGSGSRWERDLTTRTPLAE